MDMDALELMVALIEREDDRLENTPWPRKNHRTGERAWDMSVARVNAYMNSLAVFGAVYYCGLGGGVIVGRECAFRHIPRP